MNLFGFGKKQKENKGNDECCCSTTTDTVAAEKTTTTAVSSIKVLGGCCSKCHELAASTTAALLQLSMDDTVEMITDFAQIASYGVMTTPGLVIDGKVVSYGKVLKTEEVVALLQKARGIS